MTDSKTNPQAGKALPYFPPEWAAQNWLWIGFPHLAEEWPGFLDRAQEQIADFANAARAAELVSEGVMLVQANYGDIWLRDTGPLIIKANRQKPTELSAQLFDFNGWGGKYIMDGDETIGADLAHAAQLPMARSAMIFEGGAVDSDGTGLAVTTEQCLLNPNRNPDMSRADIEAELQRTLGFKRLLWLGEGLINDHTDGHVDNLARFVGPNRIVIAEATGADDPNTAIYENAAARASAFGLEVERIPSPGRIERAGEIEPASYVNFAITTRLVVVPTFGSAHDAAGVAAIAGLFPDRETVGLRADAVLAGGGGFHCASQQMPAI